MKKLLLLTLFFLFSQKISAQVMLSTSPFTASFDAIASGLPTGFTVRTGSSATALGTVAVLTTAATPWNNATGAFKNFASATAGAAASTTTQSTGTDRALGLRQTAAVGDPGAAFIFQAANTTGKTAFKLSFNLQSLDATSPRTASWRIDYGFGNNPTVFTAAIATGILTTGGSSFSNNVVNVDFGNALDNNANAVWIRIVTINTTTGAGNRPSTAIDNFNLSFSSGVTLTPELKALPTSLDFGSQSTGTTSASQNFMLSGTNVTTNTNVATTSPFSISKDNITFSTSLDYSAAEISGSPAVYVQYSPTQTGVSAGTVQASSAGANSISVALNGSGVAGDVSPPIAASTYPKTSTATTSSVSFVNNINEAGVTFFTLVPLAGNTPTPAQVKSGLDANGNAAFKSGSFLNTANSNASATITGLTEGTSYILYVVAQDNAGNLQTNVAILNATTANPPLVSAPVIISQYYEGASVNKWIELTNLSNTPINTTSPQLKLALYNVSGDAGNINITGAPSQIVNLNFTIPARGTVLIGNTGNSEVTYLSSTSAVQNSNTVINFNGNDGIALLDASNNIIDAFGQGVNAKDVSYVRSLNVTVPSPTFIADDWIRTTTAVVQNSIDNDDPNKLGVHFPPNLPPCSGPTSPATLLAFNGVTTSSISGSFTKSADANEYLIIRSLNNTLSALPVDGTAYNVGSSFGGGIVANKIVTSAFTDKSLTSATTYYYFIIPLNNISCTGGPKYYINNILTSSQTTKTLLPCAVPTVQPTNFAITTSNYNFIQGAFTPAAGADAYLVVMSTTINLNSEPVNQTTYLVGDQLGGGIVIKNGTGGTFSRNDLAQNTNYYFFVYSLNNSCSGGPLYLTAQPLLGNFKTGLLNLNKLNFYYGNLHSHSSYSDGNKDDLTKKPEDDYAFAKTAMNLDFLGISEHNHTQAGMSLANWQPGIDAAKRATTSNFVAMHGMEWGVISGGGHVIVYGIDSLIGWEPGENQIYVPKSTYTGSTGLFKIINRHGLNAIATLAHPNTTDYNNISSTYDISADSAIVGSALESGPAFSTNVTYSDPASAMSYLSYYNRMLAKGYHLGASIDHDNHNLTFGKHTRARLVVLAPALTENDLLDAIKKMRFYASEDSAAKITFTINKQPVGSIFKTAGAPQISVSSITTSAVTSIKILYGTPGSGINPTELVTGSNAILTYTDNGLPNLAVGYYYADIIEADGSRIITSPIWYTRDDAVMKKAQTINFSSTRTATFGDPDFPVGATSNNTTNNIIYTSSNTNVATIINNDVHIMNAGTVNITANQEGDTFFNPAVSKQQILTILPRTIIATADAKTKIEGTADPALSYSTGTGLVGTDNFTGALSREAGEAPGDYTIKQGTLSLSANYNIDYKSASLHIYAKPIAAISANISVPLNAIAPQITFTATTGTAPFVFTYNINGGANQTLTSGTRNASLTVQTGMVGTFVYTITNLADAYSNAAQNISTTVQINPIPLASITGASSVCLNATNPYITFTGSNGTGPYIFTYNINGGANRTISTSGNSATVIIPSATNTAGAFNYNLVSVSDINAGQNQTGFVTVTVNPPPIVVISANQKLSVSKGDVLILDATGGVQYKWTGSEIVSGQSAATLTIRPKQSGTYKVIATNASGCSSEQSIDISVIEDYKLNASTLVTPNGDGYNDKFIIKNIDYYPNNTLRIFDKSGRVIYNKQSYANDWDGTVNGSPISEGTYFYILNLGNGKGNFKGYINIIRD